MGKAIPAQHPAVVLRSHYRQLRALLAIAMIAVVGLTAAVGRQPRHRPRPPAGRPLRRRTRGGNCRAHPALGAGDL